MTAIKTLIVSAASVMICGAGLTACASGEAQESAQAEASTPTAASQKFNTDNRVSMTTNGDKRCFSANGIPDHPTGTFPNRGNPNAIAPQDVNVCVPDSPQKAEFITLIRGTMGIAVNGVQFRPNTAGYYDPDGRRGHSPNGDKNWSIDIFGARGKLGLDANNAHVGRGGLYHYHGIAAHLLDGTGSSLIGYAGDGYEIHYVGETVESGWQLKTGTRPSGPGGTYDGTYNEDYHWTGGADASGQPRLDQCNGGRLNGQYVYFVTDTYPFVSRCLSGVVSADFNKANHRAERGENGQRGKRQDGRRGDDQRRRDGRRRGER